jgi:hypothetical protein
MLQCTTEQAWIAYRWTFDKMLPGLPGPGTNAFAALIRELRPHGVTPARILVEAPTASLSDVNLRVFLLEGERAVLRISYSFFELAINYLSEGDDKIFASIVGAVFGALLEFDKDSKQGKSQITVRAHLKLVAADPETFLREHLNWQESQGSLAPDLFYYKVNMSEDSRASAIRIGATKSLHFDQALYVELTADYSIPADADLAGDEFAEDARRALSLIGLSTKSKAKETNERTLF